MHSQASNALGQITLPGGVHSKTILAALHCVGVQRYGKNEAGVVYKEWKIGNGSKGVSCGLNCWSSVLFWAFQGGAIKSGWLDTYQQAVMDGTTNGGNRGANLARENAFGFTSDRVREGPIPSCAMVFFSTSYAPLSHVALAIGGNLVVSNWLNADTGTQNPLLRAGYVHVEAIDTLKAVAGGPHCTVSWTNRAFWE